LIVTGHQPESSIGCLGQEFRGGGGQQVMSREGAEPDRRQRHPKSASIRAVLDGDPVHAVRSTSIDEGEIPYQDWKVRDEQVFSTFAGVFARSGRGDQGPGARRLLAPCRPPSCQADSLGLRFALA
jgi:hypothetical protein